MLSSSIPSENGERRKRKNRKRGEKKKRATTVKGAKDMGTRTRRKCDRVDKQIGRVNYYF